MRKKKGNRKSSVAKKSAASSSRKKRPKLASGRRKGATKGRRRKSRQRADEAEIVSYGVRGLGADSGGQAGDTQGLSGTAGVAPESVEELIEEGQSFEAEVVNGVERAPDPDQDEVRTHEVPEDDVPEEYQGTDERDVD